MSKTWTTKELVEWLNLIFGKGFDTSVLTEDWLENVENSEQAYQQMKRLIEAASEEENWNKARDAYSGDREDE